MSAPYPNLQPGSTSGRFHARVALEIIGELAEVERATAIKIAEDIGRHEWGVRERLKILIAHRLVEEAGRLPRYPGQTRGRGAMTYRLHPRVRSNG